MPVLTTVGRTEQRGVFHSGVDGVGIGERRLEMPDALELPGLLLAVVELMRGERLAGFFGGVVGKLVAVAFGHCSRRRSGFAGRRAGLMPGLAAVIGALNDLPEPAASLRGVKTIGVRG